MVIPDRTVPKGRDDGRGGKAKGAAKRPKPGSRAAAKPEAAGTAGADAAPFEESDGFRIFRAGPGGGKKSKKKLSGKKMADAVSAPAGPAEPAPGSAAETAGPADIPQSDIGQMMAGAIRSIVQDEMQRSIDRITRSVVEEALAKDGQGK